MRNLKRSAAGWRACSDAMAAEADLDRDSGSAQGGADRGFLLTEQSNSRSRDLDCLSSEQLVALFVEDDRLPRQAVAAAAPTIAAAVDAVAARLQRGGRLFHVGAGTSGRLGVLDAAECPPTFCSDPRQVQAVIAGGAPAVLRSSEGLEDSPGAGAEDLQACGVGPDDAVIGITAGGTTPYVVGALQAARTAGALTIAMACVPRDQAALPCDLDIRLLTGPELLCGSTRLKAGTATKMALNIISTGVMVRLGKVYGNRMVDVAVTNNKLRDRALRILRDLANLDRSEASALLEASGGSVKTALLMAAAGLNAHDANCHLARHHGHLRRALAALGTSLPSPSGPAGSLSR